MFWINGERAVVWNCSCVDALKGTVLHRTVPRDRVNGKPIRTYAERFHTDGSKVLKYGAIEGPCTGGILRQYCEKENDHTDYFAGKQSF